MTTDEIIALTQEVCDRGQLAVESIDAEQVDERTVRLNLQSAESALIIGRNGETLFALQHVIRLMLKRRLGDATPHVVVDVDNYRRDQEESLTVIARDVATRVRESGLAYEFPPMLSYKRRAIHTYFAGEDLQDLNAFSIGEGPRRRVRVERRGSVADVEPDLGF